MWAFFGVGPMELIIIAVILLGMVGAVAAFVFVAVAATRRGRQAVLVGCPQCGRNVPAEYAHCPHCGQALPR